MTNKEIIPNINTIHVVAELIIFGGITFYLTNKFNKTNTELIKVKTILQHQNVKLTEYEKLFKSYNDKLSNLESEINTIKKQLLSNNSENLPS